MSEFKAVLKTPELGPGESRVIDVRGDRVLLLNIGQIYYAVEARCPQSGTVLEPRLRQHQDRLFCPRDEAEYDARSGQRMDRRGRPLRRYAVRVEDNAIKVGPPLDGTG